MFAYFGAFFAIVFFLIIGPFLLFGLGRKQSDRKRERIRSSVKLRPADEQFTEPEINGGQPTRANTEAGS